MTQIPRNSRPQLEPKPPADDPARRDHQKAVKQALIELPAFGLTLLAAQVRTDAAAGYVNYELPTDPGALAFTLKGALRLEMMNSQSEHLKKYRRLFGSNTKAHDLSAWRSRVYLSVYAPGAAGRAAQAMLLPQLSEDPARRTASQAFLQQVQAATGMVVLLQVDDVYLTAQRENLFSDLLRNFLEQHSRLLRYVAAIRVLPVWSQLV